MIQNGKMLIQHLTNLEQMLIGQPKEWYLKLKIKEIVDHVGLLVQSPLCNQCL